MSPVESLNIKVEMLETPDQEVRRFRLNTVVSQREKTYRAPEEAVISPLARKLFGFPWTASVHIGSDFVDVEKQNWVDWEILGEPLAGLISEHVQDALKKSAAKTLEENPEPPKPLTVSDPLSQKVYEVIETVVNPQVASHGGRVSLVRVEGDTAFVRLEGGCHGCAMSTATLKEGIEVSIQSACPEIKHVVDVTDHETGENPFYSGEQSGDSIA